MRESSPFPNVVPGRPLSRWVGRSLLSLVMALAGCASTTGPSLSLSWQQELFWQRSACAEHRYPHDAIVAHLNGLPCDQAERLQSVTFCANGFCQTAQRDGDRWGYNHLFGEVTHHEQFRVFHEQGSCQASLLFYPPEGWVAGQGAANVSWTMQGPNHRVMTGSPLTGTVPPLNRATPLTLNVWKEPQTRQLCAQVNGYDGVGDALLTLQVKPPGLQALYQEHEEKVGKDKVQACVPLNGSRYAAAFVFVHTPTSNVERKLEIDNPDASMFSCGDGSQRP